LAGVVEEENVEHADECIVLTDRERETLAQLAESIGDPWLARQLTGQESTGRVPRRRRRPGWLRLPDLKALSGWVGALLVVAGAVLALATFAASTPLASAGLVMMGIGVWRLVENRGEGVARWVATRRAGPRPQTPADQPRPPRTPPAAA
jgi:hypothetical protein